MKILLKISYLRYRITEFNLPGQRSKYYKDRSINITDEEELQKAKDIETKKIVVACAADQHVLEAVELARVENIESALMVQH